MDYIRRPSGSTAAIIEIPFLDPLPYTLGTFDHYWCRAGYHDEESTLLANLAGKARPGLAMNCKSYDYARMIQSWLYFGFLSELTGVELDPLDFSILGPGGLRRVDSIKIGIQLSAISQKRHSTAGKLLSIVQPALLQLNSLALLFPAQQDTTLSAILLSVAVLASSLDLGSGFNYNDRSFASTRLLHDYMRQEGWCPVDIRKVFNMQRADVAYFLYRLPRHYRAGTDHAACESLTCYANKVQPGTKLPQHAYESCDCPIISVSQARLRNLIRSGQIPVVVFNQDRKTKEIRLGLRPAEANSTYVAISHVWADGLGNPDANALPHCQLLRIQKLVDTISSSGASIPESGVLTTSEIAKRPTVYWLDTLCIPVVAQAMSPPLDKPSDGNDEYVLASEEECTPCDDPDAAILRLRAINMMGAVYAGASRTLILDKELLAFPATGQPSGDVLGHVLCSTWASRCWTLQEGALSKLCYFEFKDGLFSPFEKSDTAVSAYTKEQTDTRSHPLRERIKQLLRSGRSGKIIHQLPAPYPFDMIDLYEHGVDYYLTRMLQEVLRKDDTRELVESWRLLLERATSIPDDLYIILANLLDFNSHQLATIKFVPSKIKAIICSSGSLPLSLLFNRGQKSDGKSDHHDRWLPSSIQVDNLTSWPLLRLQDGAFCIATNDWMPLSCGNPSDVLQPALVVSAIRLEGHQLVFAPRDGFHLEIEAHRRTGDKLYPSPGRFISTIIIPEIDVRHSAGMIRGACFQVIEEKSGASPEASIIYSVLYDCPVTIKCFPSPLVDYGLHASGSDTLIAEVVVSYGIEMKHEPLPNEYLLSRRRYPRLSFLGLGMSIVVPLLGSVHFASYFLQAAAMSCGQYPMSPLPVTGYVSSLAVAWAFAFTIATIIVPLGFLAADIIWIVVIKDELRDGTLSRLAMASFVLSCLKYLVPYLALPIMSFTWQRWLAAFYADKESRAFSNVITMVRTSFQDEFGVSMRGVIMAFFKRRRAPSSYSRENDPEERGADSEFNNQVDKRSSGQA